MSRLGSVSPRHHRVLQAKTRRRQWRWRCTGWPSGYQRHFQISSQSDVVGLVKMERVTTGCARTLCVGDASEESDVRNATLKCREGRMRYPVSWRMPAYATPAGYRCFREIGYASVEYTLVTSCCFLSMMCIWCAIPSLVYRTPPYIGDGGLNASTSAPLLP